jgi:hypothetical protein
MKETDRSSAAISVKLRVFTILTPPFLDECQKPGTCHKHATCTNTPGHFFCQCQAGFNGDGVHDCHEVSNFLYPHEGQKLPKAQGSKLAFRLRSPLQLFGERRNELIVSLLNAIINSYMF